MAAQPAKEAAPVYASLEAWIEQEAIPFSADSPETLHAAVDRLMAACGDTVALLGFGEALHGGEALLTLRNQLFQVLVMAHGYSAIAVESSFPKALAVDAYVAGRGADSYAAIRDTGFSHGFGQLEANRELVEWMRQYNADPAHTVKLRFYGFDSPSEMVGTDSPRRVLHFVLDYLDSVDGASGQRRRDQINALLGEDAAWENPDVTFDPAQSIGLSAEAAALRIETEELISELHVRRPELIASTGKDRYLEAMQHAVVARQLLNYHAALARPAENRTAWLLGIRDAMMADNLAYVAARERDRGKVLVFAHNNHLQRGQTQWQLGPDLLTWWPAGAHLHEMPGAHYVVIGSGLGVSEANGIARPEAGTLEARLTATPGPARLIPTHRAHRGQGLPQQDVAALGSRSGSRKNPTYFPLTAQSLTDFDWLLVLDSTPYSRGGPPLPAVDEAGQPT